MTEKSTTHAQRVGPTNSFMKFKKDEIEQSIPHRFEQMVQMYPDQLAVKTRNDALTYGALDRASNQVARAILDRIGPAEEPVVLLLEHGLPPIIALWGALKAGKGYVALRPADPPGRLQTILSDVRAPLIVTNQRNSSLADRLAPDNSRILNVDETAHLSMAAVDLPLSPDGLAAIFYTSGSTGKPKGVVHSHRSLLHLAWRNTHYYQLGPGDRYFDPFVCGFIASAVAILDALLNGAALYLYNVQEIPAHQLASRLIRDQITFLHPTVTLFRQLLETLESNENLVQVDWHLRWLPLSGENIYKHDVERFRRHFPPDCRLLHRFSSTETGIVSYLAVDRESPNTGKVLPVGYATADTEILLLDDNGRSVSPGQVGEIAVRSRYLAAGYWRRPELTQTKFLADPEDGNQRIYLTGDLGRQQPDGCLEHLGRKDFQVKVRGYTVSTATIEAALLELEEVKEALVVTQENQAGESQLVAYLVPYQPPAPTVTTLRRTLAQTLPDYMIPAAFVTLARLPLTATGKIDRRALPLPSQARPDLETPFVAPRTPLEEALAQIWTEVLSVDQVGIHDNFLELGGHSLAATQVISRVIDRFRIELPLKFLFDSPTVADMAAVITQNQAKKAGQEELARVLAEVESLSDEEARQRLADESKK